MFKVQTILLILAFAGLASASQLITFTCEQVSTSICMSTFRYRTQGSYQTVTLNSSYCLPVGEVCFPNTKKFNLQSCVVDYKNEKCSTGVCFMYPEVQICAKDLTCGNVASPLSYDADYSCEDCGSLQSNCSKCFIQRNNKTNATVTLHTCLGPTCTEGLATSNTSVDPCLGGWDSLGQKCQCCVKTVQVSRFCTTNSDGLRQADVTAWFNKVEKKYEAKLQIMFALLVLSFIGIFY